MHPFAARGAPGSKAAIEERNQADSRLHARNGGM